MLTKDEVVAKLGALYDPFLRQTFSVTGGIREVNINEEKQYVRVKIALGGSSDLSEAILKQDIIEFLKYLKFASVSVSFLQLAEDVVTDYLLPEPIFITVTSGKGGVGKSSLSIGLALMLLRKGKRVGLIDADIYGFSIPALMGVQDQLSRESNLLDPIEFNGIKIMSMGFLVDSKKPIIWRGPMLGKMLHNFLFHTNWGELDYIIIDLPPGTGDVALDVHQKLPKTKEIVVTTPHSVASEVATRAGVMAKDVGHEIIGVIENMSYLERGDGERSNIFGEGGGNTVANNLETELLGQVPIVDTKHMFDQLMGDDSDFSRVISEMADKVILKTK